jgi:hypothetical protein
MLTATHNYEIQLRLLTNERALMVSVLSYVPMTSDETLFSKKYFVIQTKVLLHHFIN